MKTLRAVGRGLRVFAAAACLLCTAALLYTGAARLAGNPFPTVFGWGSAVVISGSMEPELPVGALIWLHSEDSYHPGEIVLYEDEDGGLVTHRLVSVENGIAVTKGDANNTEDKPIRVERIRARLAAVWPFAGRVLLFMKTLPGMLLLLLFGGLILFLPNFFRKGGN